MSQRNFERMVALATEVFDVKNDPEQLDVDQSVIERLAAIHPATRQQFSDDNGPAVWILVLPTTGSLMRRFLDKEISEKQLFYLTEPGIAYDTIYLCSAMVLEEYRRKGIAKRLTVEAIEAIRRDHPIKALFFWPFSAGGDALAESIARSVGLPLYRREHLLGAVNLTY